MALHHRLVALAALTIAAPALAEERALRVDVPASRLDEAARILARQSGASIGFRDGRLGPVRVQAVRGVMTAGEALDRMLRYSRLRAVRVAPATYLIEAVPAPPADLPPRPGLAPRPRVPSAPEMPLAAPAPEILVVGAKRDVPLSAYPGGVQIIEGRDISAAEAAHGSDAIVTRLAGVSSTHLGNGRNKLFIRGIADSSFVGPTQATVGQYWGESRITYSAPDPSLRLYDVGRIEVLEGPQGTLYGAGSLGGVVRVVPSPPDPSRFGGGAWTGVQAVQHGDPGVDGGAVLNLPLQRDRLALRAVGFAARDGGYIDDVGRGLDDVNKVTTFGGRAALRFDPGDGLTVDASVIGQKIKGEDSQYAERDAGGLSRSSTVAQPYRNAFWLAELAARKQWDDLELRSSFALARQSVFERFEGGELSDIANPAAPPAFGAPTTAFSQSNRIAMLTSETRLSRRGPAGTGWLVGFSLLRNRATVHREMGLVTLGQPLTGVRNRVFEATIFGEAAFEPADRVIVTLGGRFTLSRLSGSAQDVTPGFAATFDPTASATRTEKRFLPSFAVAWKADGGVTLYARYQQGFRPGGIAVRRAFIEHFKSDRVETAELGGRVHSRALEFDVTGSVTRWRNIQADLIDGYGFPATLNIGDGRILSAGASARWRPVEGLELDAALYVNDTKVTERSDAALAIALAQALLEQAHGPQAASVANFRQLPNIADLGARAGFAWTRPVGRDWELGLSGYLRYTGKSTLGIGPILGQAQGNTLDTGLELKLGRGRHALRLSLTNLFDARGNRFALGSPFLVRDRNQITPLQPRSLRVGYEFTF